MLGNILWLCAAINFCLSWNAFSLETADQSVERPDFKTRIQAQKWESSEGDLMLRMLLPEHCQIWYIDNGNSQKRHSRMTEMTESETIDFYLLILGAAINEAEMSFAYTWANFWVTQTCRFQLLQWEILKFSWKMKTNLLVSSFRTEIW